MSFLLFYPDVRDNHVKIGGGAYGIYGVHTHTHTRFTNTRVSKKNN